MLDKSEPVIRAAQMFPIQICIDPDYYLVQGCDCVDIPYVCNHFPRLSSSEPFLSTARLVRI